MTTTIAWTGETWNPIAAFDKETGKRGWICARVSPGCENCYAEAMNRWVGNRHRYRVPELAKVDIRIDPKMLAWPLELKKPEKIFVCSMTDLFLDEHTDEMIDQVFAVMLACPQHTFQVLTKRPERAKEYLTKQWRLDDIYGAGYAIGRPVDAEAWPLPNVWLGVSAEDQKRADERIPILRETPAAVRWVSYEPALGPVDLRNHLWPVHAHWPAKYPSPEAAIAAGEEVGYKPQGLISQAWAASLIHWVVVGGESGRGARAFDPAWAESIVTQCKNARAFPFVKQMGSVIAKRDGYADHKGEDPSEWPEALRVREYPR
jgi:protein gp37